MPVMGGLDATREILNTVPPERQPVIIALTADVFKDTKDMCLSVGMHDVLTKPIDLGELLSVLYPLCKKYWTFIINQNTNARNHLLLKLAVLLLLWPWRLLYGYIVINRIILVDNILKIEVVLVNLGNRMLTLNVMLNNITFNFVYPYSTTLSMLHSGITGTKLPVKVYKLHMINQW
jgi:CheY-like chemotaxis protein